MGRIFKFLLILQVTFLLIFPLLGEGIADAEPIRETERVMGAAPRINFRLSSSAVNFGGGTIEPSFSRYTDVLYATINANKAWRLSVSKDHDLTGVSGTIPSENLTFAAEGPPGKTTFAATPGTQFGTNTGVVEGTRGSFLTTTITYSLNVPWTLEPDTYSATHTYTAMLI